MQTLKRRLLIQPLNVSELLKNSIVLFFTLNKKIFLLVLFVLISLHQFANGTDTFVVSYFVFSFVLAADHQFLSHFSDSVFTQKLMNYLLPCDCYFSFCCVQVCHRKKYVKLSSSSGTMIYKVLCLFIYSAQIRTISIVLPNFSSQQKA